MPNENDTIERKLMDLSLALDPERRNGWSEKIDSILADHMREMAELDSQIIHLSFDIDRSNALIRELADALNSYLAGECIDCGAKCEGDGACVHQKNLRTLVAKAREVVK